MSVAYKIVSQPLQSAGFDHVQNAVGVQLDSGRGLKGCIVSSGGSYAQTQQLVIRNTSWAETNLEITISSAGAPSEEEVAAAEAAIARLTARSDEDAEEWATVLGNKLGAIID
ncbi:hypothetical protein HJB90_01675 [Rhizobium sp. NLR10a]|uniref:hypothetical protein n=1 Tax=unclassified Rhizobium TaxID=2613769 RepID=UPI001C8283F4|nr:MULTISPECIES: hypothetical protein [unclassified Rhizobium]MBX5214395.1 hypothetical protein [Rhizobium sp. NLR9a]MBX5273680.1 hypothetical protein [Rhizobium sp. NLR13a]MBX5279770.1 hypothetical protein [Rhizobium sp. NLR10a]MBX5291684.1 hypothetical protein [Rhizobium sp. NLR15a]